MHGYNPFSLKGKKIVVSGGTSGIGRQCAIDFAGMGASVLILGRNAERLESAMRELEVLCKPEQVCVSLQVDLAVSEEVKNVGEFVKSNFGPIDGIVNCAGSSTTLPLKFMSREKIEELFASNVFSAIELTRELSKPKLMNSGGSIIFLGSIMGILGDNCKSLYSMTKGALISAARSLAVEFAPRNIRVNSISPGLIITPINQNLPHIANPEARIALEKQFLLGLGKTTDVTNCCIYLLSEAARWITGQNFIIDGGFSVR